MLKNLRGIVCGSALLVACCFSLSTKRVEAQSGIKFQIDGRAIVINRHSSSEAKKVLDALSEGRKVVVAPKTPLLRGLSKNARISLRVGSRNVEAFKPMLSNKRLVFNTKSQNKKTLEATQSLINALLGILGLNVQGSSLSDGVQDGSDNLVSIYKSHTLVNCQEPQVSVATLDEDLAKMEIPVISSSCASVKGERPNSHACGAQYSVSRIHKIQRSDLSKALLVGYRPIEWLESSLEEISCESLESTTRVMYLTIFNTRCEDPGLLLELYEGSENFNQLKKTVLGCGLGYSRGKGASGCSFPTVIERKISVPKAQLELAQTLGYRTVSSNLEGLELSDSCPVAVPSSAPAGTIEMVGEVRRLCPPYATVESFDRQLSDAGLTILGTACGARTWYEFNVCGVLKRLYVIPAQQEGLATSLGLSRRDSLDMGIVYGLECR